MHDESCACVHPHGNGHRPRVRLMYACESTHYCCVECNGRVERDTLGLSDELAAQERRWAGVYEAIFALWLDSGDDEPWALRELEAPSSAVNRLGREIVRRAQAMNDAVTFFYWMHRDESHGETPDAQCPHCHRAMTRVQRGNVRALVCDQDRLVCAG